MPLCKLACAALALVVIVGCDNDTSTFVSHVELVRASANPCRGTPSGGALQTMDTQIIEAFEVVDGQAASFLPSFCRDCFSNPVACRPPVRLCRCGPARMSLPSEMAMAVSGARVDLLPNKVYCLRVLALQTSRPQQNNAWGACACEPTWSSRGFLDRNIRLCALGPPASSAQFDQRLEVRCPNDLVETGSLLNACYQPMLP